MNSHSKILGLFRLWLALSGALLVLAPAGVTADTLGKMRAEALERNLKHIVSRDAAKRADAAQGLGGYDDPRAVAALATALGDAEVAVREAAASALWKTGKDAAAARPPLEGALSDPDPAVRVRAAGALEAIGVDPAALVAVRRSVAADGDWFDQALAIRDLLGHVPPAELVAPLTASLRRTPPGSRTAFDDPDDDFSGASVLRPLAATDDPEVSAGLAALVADPAMPRVALVDAVGRSAAVPPGWADTLVGLSRDRDPRLREAVAEALERLAGREDGAAGWPSRVVHLLGDPETDVRFEAVRAFGAAKGEGHPGARQIAGLVADTDADLAEAAIDALGDIGDVAEPFDRELKRQVAEVAAPALLAAVESADDEDLRRAAIDAYIRLANDPVEAAGKLAGFAVGDYPEGVRVSAVRALGPLGRAAEAALPVLVRLEADPEPLISSAAVWSREQVERGLAMASDLPAEAGSGTIAVPSGGDPAAAQRLLRERGLEMTSEQLTRSITEVDAEAVVALLEAGVSAIDAGTTGFSPLHQAVMFSCKYGERPTSEAALAIVDALLAHGADPDALDAQGNPVLIRAAGACDGEAYRRLIAAGADAGAKNPMGMTAFAMALTLGDVEVAEVLVGAGFHLAPEEAATMRQWFPDDAEKLRLIALAAR